MATADHLAHRAELDGERDASKAAKPHSGFQAL